MADIPHASIAKIAEVGLAIKEAVETVQLNKEDCLEIKKLALRVTTILKWLEETKIMQDPATREALVDLEESLRNVLTLVTACQGDVVCLFCKARQLSKKLRRTQDDIERKVMLGVFATILTNIECPPHLQPQNTDASSRDTTFGSLLDGLTEFSLAEIEDATNFFSHCNFRGEGSFGYIYKGTLKDGQLVSIKTIRKCRGLSDKQITCELAFIAKAEHKNIVKCLGYAARETWFCLVQEFVQNGELDRINWDAVRADWSCRFQLIKGIAQGLNYLHEQGFVHMDLKPSNILLDSDMNAKITDFGISRMFAGSTSASDARTITSTVDLVGTMGYMAPEYIFYGEISFSIDVYAFGIILLGTIINGMCMCEGDPPRTGPATIEWAREARGKNNRQLMGLFPMTDESQLKEIKSCLDIGLRCAETDRRMRPTMADVVAELDT